MMVLVRANGTFRSLTDSSHMAGDCERRLKYMAKRPAKNITSLPSQTMVPTEAVAGRFTDCAVDAEMVAVIPQSYLLQIVTKPISASKHAEFDR